MEISQKIVLIWSRLKKYYDLEIILFLLKKTFLRNNFPLDYLMRFWVVLEFLLFYEILILTGPLLITVLSGTHWRRQLEKLGWTKTNFLDHALQILGKAIFSIFFIYFEISGHATFSSSISHNCGIFASVNIEIYMIVSTPWRRHSCY